MSEFINRYERVMWAAVTALVTAILTLAALYNGALIARTTSLEAELGRCRTREEKLLDQLWEERMRIRDKKEG